MMLNWLKKKLGLSESTGESAATPEPATPLPSGVSERALELLMQDFSCLQPLAPGLPDRIMEFLIVGSNAEVLAQIARTAGAGEKFDMQYCSTYRGDLPDPRRKFCNTHWPDNPHFLVRLARVWAAIASTDQRRKANTWLPDELRWLEVFLAEVVRSQTSYPAKFDAVKTSLTAECMQALLVAANQPPDLLIRAFFEFPRDHWYSTTRADDVGRVPHFAAHLQAHSQPVGEMIQHAKLGVRVFTLKYLAETKTPVLPWLPEIVQAAVATSKQVREQAEKLLAMNLQTARPLLEKIAVDGNNAERLEAVRLIYRLYVDAAHEFLQQRLEAEINVKVKDALSALVAVNPPAGKQTYELPPITPVEYHVPLPASVRDLLRRAFVTCREELHEENQARLKTKYNWQSDLTGLDTATADQLFDLLADGRADTIADAKLDTKVKSSGQLQEHLKPFYQVPEVHLIHVVRLYMALHGISSRHYELHHFFNSSVEQWRKAHKVVLTLRELAAVFETLRYDPDLLARQCLQHHWGGLRADQASAESVWQFFAERLPMLSLALRQPDDRIWPSLHQRLKVISCFPTPPDELIPIVWELAIGPKSARREAQDALTRDPQLPQRLIAALKDGRSEVRQTVAEWLSRVTPAAAIEPLIAAVHKEKNDAAKGAMMVALERLQVPIEQFLDRAKLHAEATKGLAKVGTKALEWLMFDTLPTVYWEDNSDAVVPEIVHWFLVQANKVRNPAPGPLLRRYCAAWRKADREALGLAILQAWLAYDTAPIAREAAEKKAQAHAQQMVNWYTTNTQWFQQPVIYQQEYDRALARFLVECHGSAIEFKGVLAVAGACCSGAAAPIVGRYLKQWYGYRGAQCKALIQMLAWIEHPAAVQLLLAVGNRFRTKGIQAEAAAQATAVAERNGWTLEELAFRTIPSAGFDENAQLELDYGGRKFQARLGDDLSIHLTNEDGKTIANLPDPRKDDDEAMAKTAKKLFSATKKELNSIVKMQSERLYEALCVQTGYKFGDWQMYLHEHPIMRLLVRRVVWLARRENQPPVWFRPLPDGTLSDVADQTVPPPIGATIVPAHDSNTPAETAQAWLTHLADYEVEPLFTQFGRTQFELAADQTDQTAIETFKGHMLDAFKLRNRATKLGYARGAAQDGGWFLTYHKRVTTLQLEAVIDFTGNGLPEENRKVALINLHFSRLVQPGQETYGENSVQLGEVPAVLLRECYADLQAIAGEGTGFDPEWEKKAYA